MVKSKKTVKTAKTVAKKKTVVTKKPAVKKAVKKSAVMKSTLQKADYDSRINSKKWEAHDKNWLYIEVNAGDLNAELEELDNLDSVCGAMMDALLEGDSILVNPDDGASRELTVRYYVDNLAPERKKYNGEVK